MVTIEDVVETLLGMEIVDEMDRVEDKRALGAGNGKSGPRLLGWRGKPMIERSKEV